jgi:hypothetical protein
MMCIPHSRGSVTVYSHYLVSESNAVERPVSVKFKGFPVPYSQLVYLTVKFLLFNVFLCSVFKSDRVLRIFGPKREEDGSWRKLHNDELHSLYSSPNILMVIKTRRMSWA